ncbi:MAG: hypothetical protein WAK95_20375, partial [Desulfobacterales bacterium]
ELLHQRYFFTAEAGIARAIKQLEQPFVTANAPLVRTGSQASWTFALDGSVALNGAGDCGAGIGCYENGNGVTWLDNMTLNGARYRVTLWNNDDSAIVSEGFNGAFNRDTDALIWLRADADGPKGGGASVQILLEGDTTGESVTGYTAQAGAGAGKNYNANDLNPITSFGRQL